jgi:hypothetical protein
VKNFRDVLLGVSIVISSLVLVACGSGSDSAPATATATAPGFAQTFTASVQAGEVLQIGVDTTNMTYSYKVIQSSYGILLGQTGTGVLSIRGDSVGNLKVYTVAASADNFIQGGVVFPIQNGVFVGHALINAIGHAQKIPIFGVSNPITTLAGLADTYNFEGFSCSGLSGGNAGGGIPCLSKQGTVRADALGNVTVCKNGNISTGIPACNPAAQNGTITTTATPGIFNFAKTGVHKGWFFAFTAPNGQKVAMLDNDDTGTPEFGHSVAATQAVVNAGQADGNYFTKDNMGGEWLVTVAGTTFTSTKHPGATGTLIYNTPWTGMVTTSINGGANTGIAMLSGTGTFTKLSDQNTAEFAIGLMY